MIKWWAEWGYLVAAIATLSVAVRIGCELLHRNTYYGSGRSGTEPPRVRSLNTETTEKGVSEK